MPSSTNWPVRPRDLLGDAIGAATHGRHRRGGWPADLLCLDAQRRISAASRTAPTRTCARGDRNGCPRSNSRSSSMSSGPSTTHSFRRSPARCQIVPSGLPRIAEMLAHAANGVGSSSRQARVIRGLMRISSVPTPASDELGSGRSIEKPADLPGLKDRRAKEAASMVQGVRGHKKRPRFAGLRASNPVPTRARPRHLGRQPGTVHQGIPAGLANGRRNHVPAVPSATRVRSFTADSPLSSPANRGAVCSRFRRQGAATGYGSR